MENKKPKFKRGTPEEKEWLKRIGSLGGRANVDKHGIEHMRELGRRGGDKVSKERGVEHYRKIGKMGLKELES